jgi:hypothetical protein
VAVCLNRIGKGKSYISNEEIGVIVMRRIAIMWMLLSVPSMSAPVWAQDCSPLKPDRTVDTEVKNKTEAEANVLLKSLGSGTLKNDYSRIETNQVFRNVDEVHRWDSFLYMVCSILSNSNLSPLVKLDRVKELYSLKQEGPPPPARPITEGDTSHSDDPRSRFGPGAVRFKGKEITVSNCGVGGCGVTVRFSVENASGVDIEAALRRGSISVGSCTNIETTSSGLPYAFGAGSERMTWSNIRVIRYKNFVDGDTRIPRLACRF